MVREFFYVDVGRARSYLAQLDKGVVESVIERVEHDIKADVKASLFGLGGAGGIGRATGREESRSLQDLTFTVFEELAVEQGFLLDATADFADADMWLNGALHDSLVEGQLLRIRSDIQILDPRFFTSRIERIESFADALIDITTEPPSVKPGSNKGQQKRLMEHAKEATRAALWSGTDPNSVKAIAGVVNSLLGDSIAVRVIPCGDEHAELSFGGALIDRTEYIQPEREALFSRYGSILRGWSCVLQIASLPLQDEPTSMDLNTELLGPGKRIKRATFEQFVIQFITLMESIGMAEGPRWPSISVTPLAIYREVVGRS